MDGIQQQYNELLMNISSELDIPPSKYQQAVERYKSVGNWLQKGVYENCTAELDIYPQGSFRLGTVARPIKKGVEADYDIDLVCCLPILKPLTTPEKVKNQVGKRLKENASYSKMLDDEGRRCWTLNYAEQDGIGFHMDILPSIPEGKQIIDTVHVDVPIDFAGEAIAITNKEINGEYSWLSSNPKGYASWFEYINQPMLMKTEKEQKCSLFEKNRHLFRNVDDVPMQLLKTPLQRVIQILKRHRDMRFINSGLEQDKPISMIITTLAARLYRNEGDVYTTLKNIVEKLAAHSILLQPDILNERNIRNLNLIYKKPDGTWYIPNPVNPAENFADRWHENNDQKAKAFFRWVEWVSSDLLDVLAQTDINLISKSLEHTMGENLVKEALAQMGHVTSSHSSIYINIPTIDIKPSKPWGL
jgi:hypothetical protein